MICKWGTSCLLAIFRLDSFFKELGNHPPLLPGWGQPGIFPDVTLPPPHVYRYRAVTVFFSLKLNEALDLRKDSFFGPGTQGKSPRSDETPASTKEFGVVLGKDIGKRVSICVYKPPFP